MVTRRQLLQNTALFTGGLIMGCTNSNPNPARTWVMPDEAMPHQRTWMAFGASEQIWGRQLLPEVRRNLVTIAQTIAQYEPVSMLVRAEEYDLAKNLLGASIELVVSPLDDLWIRDTGPLFVWSDQGKKAAINFNFNGWGQKQVFAQDATVAELVAGQAEAEVINTSLVLEGGCIEVDGHGTAIITESCVLNENRNPGVSKAQFEDLLMPLLGLEKIIWLPGIKGYDITDGHTDFYARFASPGVVLAGYEPNPEYFDHEVTKQHLEILQTATDAQGQSLEVIVLEAPGTIRSTYETEDFAAGYIGFYACNGAIIMQDFGDGPADQAAQQALQQAFLDREIVAINIDGIAAGGGSIHCATQQEPMLVATP
ncbi:agmatine deiminase family protein [Leptothoe sp. PORK10 BA2]|uniref:agmatine deiminase family protein n=1 Tax=Leptothoe sp. PORK10 BA2 TaxID=3110254 RepID=UPI002B212037|nr:agmatine deiminase family protein [Leptothoe sp. PORK10 BA2]MEA5466320.1 agmatine deiminase family protein [Leptothoe sp. PORK10 BA2]